MSTFINDAGSAIFAKLTGASALTTLLSAGTASVFRSLAPEEAATPYVVYNAQSPSVPVRTMGGVAYDNALYLVKAVTESHSAVSAGQIAAQIITALDPAPLTLTGYTHMRCSREQDVDYEELAPGGKRFQHRGAVFRVQTTT